MFTFAANAHFLLPKITIISDMSKPKNTNKHQPDSKRTSADAVSKKTVSAGHNTSIAAQASAEQPAIWWKNKTVLLCLAGILALTFGLYFKSLSNDFINWDDPHYVYENSNIWGLGAENMKYIWTEFVVANYHPLSVMSLAFNYVMGGLNPYGYHLTNVLLHLINCLLVFVFVYRLSDRKTDIALLSSLLFAVHPLHVESVAWVAERKDLLYTVFLLPALILYLKYRQSPSALLYACILFSYLLSLLSKPAAVIFPLLLLCIDYFQHRKIDAKVIIEKIPFFALSLLFGIITILAQKDSAIGEFEQYPFYWRLMFPAYGFVMYIIKLFFPVNQSLLYPYPQVATGLPATYPLCLLLTAGIVALAVWSAKYTRVVVFSLLFYFFNLVLVLQFLSVGEAIMSERYTYMAYVGLFILIGYGYRHLAANNPSLKPVLVALLGVSCLAFSYKTYNRLDQWKNSETIWTDMIQQYPNRSPSAYNNRGHYLRSKNKLKEALADLDIAIQLHPKYHLAFVNRGNTYFSLGKNDEALADYNKAIELKNDYPEAYGNRGSVYFQRGQYDLAMQDYNKALELKKDYPDAYLNRAVTYSVLQKHDLAVQDYNSYIATNKDNPKAYHWRGLGEQNLKQLDKAIPDFDRAIALDGKNPEFYINRSKAHAELGNKMQALADAQKAQSLGGKVDAAYLQSLSN